MIPKMPMSDLLIETVNSARAHGGELVRLPRFRGCWTWRGCPSKPGAGSLNHGDMPEWAVGDNTIHSLIRRGIAVVTHRRAEGRPAVVMVNDGPKREYLLNPRLGTLDTGDGPMHGTICAFLNEDGTAAIQFKKAGS